MGAWSKETPKVGCVCLPPYCDKTKQSKAWSENAPKVGCISSQKQGDAWSKEAPKVGCISSQTQNKAWSENAPKVGCISSQKQDKAWSKEAPKVGCISFSEKVEVVSAKCGEGFGDRRQVANSIEACNACGSHLIYHPADADGLGYTYCYCTKGSAYTPPGCVPGFESRANASNTTV